MSRVSMIAAIGRNRELGKGNELLWRIPDDLKRVRMLTNGHPLIMGRKTFDSIIDAVGKPLSGRPHIVITRNSMWDFVSPTSDPVIRAQSIEEGIEVAQKAPGGEEVFVFGGAQIYQQALPFTEKLYLTRIDDEKEADSFFPLYEDQFTKVTFEEAREYEGRTYHWVDLER